MNKLGNRPIISGIFDVA